MQHFAKLFETLNPQEKSDYLLKILNKKPKLKNAFMEQYNDRLEEIRLNGYFPEDIEKILKEIKEKAKELTAQLNTLDFEETNWDRWRSPDHYMPEWEAAHEVAEDEAMEIFSPWLSEFKFALKAGNLVDILKQYLIIFDGSMQCEINDPNNDFYDTPEQFFIDTTNSLLKQKTEIFDQRKFLSADYLNAFELAFRFYKENYEEEDELLKGMSEIFVPLIKNKEIAGYAWQKKEEHDIDFSPVPLLLEQIVSNLGDTKLWLTSMEECFLNNYDTSIKLMDYYFENDKEKFDANAPVLYAEFKNAAKYLAEKIIQGTGFHIVILKNLCERQFSKKYFEELKKYLNNEDLEIFMDSLPPSDSKAEIFAMEGQYNKLIQLIRKECMKGSSFFNYVNFSKAISLLVDVNPDESWKLYKERIKALMPVNRGRETYQEIAGLLKTAMKIKNKEAEAGLFIKEMYNSKPNLPALKDEFRKAGLV